MHPATVSPIGVEVLDDPAAPAPLVERMLGDIARANRWLGGAAAVTTGLAALLDPADRHTTLTLLDLGTGVGDLPRAAARWAARRRVTLRSVGIERHRTAAAMACGNGVATVVACATRLPFRVSSPRSAAQAAARHERPDLILVSQLLHHFDDDAAVAILAEANATARRGVIVADLRPSRLAATGFRLAGRALGLARVTIDDGITSLRRGRDAAALVRLARAAGAHSVRARELGRGRVLATWRTAG